MKKILILGDIHANYPALKVILNYVRPNRFHRVVNTGDLTVCSTFPNETIQWFRETNKSACILGNTDKRVMYFWTSENLLPENVGFLKSLPKHSDFKIKNIHIGVFHGSFDDENETLFPETLESRFRKLANDSTFQVHIMGHSHVPYYKIVSGVLFVNPGSVGRMFDGDPRTSFAILKVSSEGIKIEHFRIPYSV